MQNKIPDCQNAVIEPQKITAYLLNPSHPDGKSKAGFFTRFGFVPGTVEPLAGALKSHACSASVFSETETPFGKKRATAGPLETPDGRNPGLTSVWETREGSNTPRLITAYP